jgi:hypothetical protein
MGAYGACRRACANINYNTRLPRNTTGFLFLHQDGSYPGSPSLPGYYSTRIARVSVYGYPGGIQMNLTVPTGVNRGKPHQNQKQRLAKGDVFPR